jgi:hypothetical protein
MLPSVACSCLTQLTKHLILRISFQASAWTATPPSRSQGARARGLDDRRDNNSDLGLDVRARAADIDQFAAADDDQQQQHRQQHHSSRDRLNLSSRQTVDPADSIGATQLPLPEQQQQQHVPQSPLYHDLLQQQQQRQYQHQHATPNGRPSDPKTSLFMKQINAKGLAFCFFVMLWRALHHFEIADALVSPKQRLALVVPSLAMVITNALCLLACCVSGTSFKHKMRMKTALSLNSLIEGLLLASNVIRLLLGGTLQQTKKAEYVGQLLVNFWFLTICFSFAKMHWV